MNPTQIGTTLAPIISFLAGVLAAKNVFGLTSEAWANILGGVIVFGSTVWAAITTRKSALVSTVADMPEVKSVALQPTTAGHALDAVTPGNVSVVRPG